MVDMVWGKENLSLLVRLQNIAAAMEINAQNTKKAENKSTL